MFPNLVPTRPNQMYLNLVLTRSNQIFLKLSFYELVIFKDVSSLCNRGNLFISWVISIHK